MISEMAINKTPRPIISIEVSTQLGDRRWRVRASTKNDNDSTAFRSIEFELGDPLRNSDEDGKFRWLLEEYANEPFSSPRLKAGRQLFALYRASLEEQLEPLLEIIDDAAGPITLRILFSAKEAGIDRLHWEILDGGRDEDGTPALELPPLEVQRVLEVPSPRQPAIAQIPRPQGPYRILAVEARSYTEPDVQPRLSTLPLVQTIDAIPPQPGPDQIHVDYIRPGTFEEFTRVLSQHTGEIDLVHFDLHGNSTEKGGATIEFVSPNLQHRESRSAKEVGEALASNGVRWAVLCACKTATSTGMMVANNLAAQLLRCGLRGVVAMRYELKSVGAKVFAAAFYDALCARGLPFVQSTAEARRAMERDGKRAAQYQEMVEIPDYIVPAVYMANGVVDWDVPLFPRPTTPSLVGRHPRGAARQLVGREAEIRLIEKAILADSTFIAVSGALGTGKSCLLEHLAWWWKATRFFQRVVLVKPKRGDVYGIHRLARSLRDAVSGQETPISTSASPMDTIRDTLYDLNGKNAVVLLDGLEELYTPTCASADTIRDWQNLFRLVGLLSRNCCPVVVALTDTSWAFPPGTTDNIHIIRLSRFSVQDSRILLAGYGVNTNVDRSQAEPEVFLANVCEALDYNPAAILRHGSRIKDPSAGISNILAWKQDWTTETDQEIRESGKYDGVIYSILALFERAGWKLEAALLQLIGVFTHVVPDLESLQPFLTAVSDTLLDDSKRLRLMPASYGLGPDSESTVSFTAWQYFHSLGPPTGDVKVAASRCIQQLLALSLLWKDAVRVAGNKQGHHIHALATLSLRNMFNASFQSTARVSICEAFKAFYEDRAMSMLADKPGMSRYEMPTRVFVHSEKWNLVAAIAQPLPAREKDAQYFDDFAFVCFAAIKPFAATDTSYSSEFLWHCVVRNYLQELYVAVQQQAHLPMVVEKTRIMIVINWAVDFIQRRRQKEDEPWLLHLRLSIMDGEVAADPTGKISSVHQQALLSNITAAIRNGDAAMQESAVRRAKAARDADPEGWGEKGKMLDCLIAASQLSDFSISNPSASVEEIRNSLSNMRGLAQDPTALPPTMSRALLAQLNAVDKHLTASASLGPDPLGDATQSDLVIHIRTGMIQEKINTLGLGRALPEPHMKYLRIIAKQLGKRDLPMVKKTAEAALRVSRAGEDHFATDKWRSFCEFLGSLDTPFFYEEMRDYLVKWTEERPRNAVARLIRLLVQGDTPLAYTFVKEVGPYFGSVGLPKEAEVCRQMVPVLEGYKTQRLDLGEEWFRVYQSLYRILKDMAQVEVPGEA